MTSPLNKSDFADIEHVTHLASGGESPALRSHTKAALQFLHDKSAGMQGRERMFAAVKTLKEGLGRMMSVDPLDIALLASASEGLFVVAQGLDWRPGDNVVVALSEFPSVLHTWRLIHGIEIRAVGESVVPRIDEIQAAIDSRTRVIAASHVSYLSGVRLDLGQLRQLADTAGARLVIDASHSLGVVEVDGGACDALVCCAYKWLLGVHGTGVLYVNHRRWPDLVSPWVGWHSIQPEDDWSKRLRAEPKTSIERFEIGNYNFMSSYVLQNGVEFLLATGISSIERHVQEIGGALIRELERMSMPVLTPRDPSARGGNIAVATDRSDQLERYLRERNILTWSGDRRLRISVHGYNDEEDVRKIVDALSETKNL